MTRAIDTELYKQPRLQSPVKKPLNRAVFWQDYVDLTTPAFIKKYAGYSIVKRVRRILGRISFLRAVYRHFS